MRDSRLTDLFEILGDMSVGYVAMKPKTLRLGWLLEATQDWQKDCQLPPGCKLIKLDKWLGQTDRPEQFADFMSYAIKVINSGDKSDPVIASEAEKILNLLKELRGGEIPE